MLHRISNAHSLHLQITFFVFAPDSFTWSPPLLKLNSSSASASATAAAAVACRQSCCAARARARRSHVNRLPNKKEDGNDHHQKQLRNNFDYHATTEDKCRSLIRRRMTSRALFSNRLTIRTNSFYLVKVKILIQTTFSIPWQTSLWSNGSVFNQTSDLFLLINNFFENC